MKKVSMFMAAALVAFSFAAEAKNNKSLVALTCHGEEPGPACSASAELLLSGTVTTACAITVTPTAAATALNITGGETNTLVATVNEQSNNLAGYRVTVRSANGGNLVNAAEPTSMVAYQLSYDGGALVAPTTTAQEVKNSGPLVAPANDNSDVRITFAATPAATAGTYTDTLTFEIASL